MWQRQAAGNRSAQSVWWPNSVIKTAQEYGLEELIYASLRGEPGCVSMSRLLASDLFTSNQHAAGSLLYRQNRCAFGAKAPIFEARSIAAGYARMTRKKQTTQTRPRCASKCSECEGQATLVIMQDQSIKEASLREDPSSGSAEALKQSFHRLASGHYLLRL